MPEKTLLNDANFLEFLVTAKKNTYAADGNAEMLRNGGNQYIFYDGERWPQWRYRDIYYGYNPFFGYEVAEETTGAAPLIWMPMAQMSYNGYAKGTETEVKRMFAFLKKVLQQVSERSPFRGPSSGVIYEDDMQYICRGIHKDPFRVNGHEAIQIFPNYYVEYPAYYGLNFQFCCLR